jgi:hypothetical protein
MIDRSVTRIGVVIAVLAAFSARPANGQVSVDSAPLIKTISAAWSKRQAAIRTARIGWREQKTVVAMKDVVSSSPGDGPTSGVATDGLVAPPMRRAPVVVRYKQSGTLCLDGNRFAFTYDATGLEQLAPPGSPGSNPSRFKVVRTESEYLRYSDRQAVLSMPAPGPTAVLTLRRPDRCREAQYPDVYPLVLAVRPLVREVSFVDLEHYRPLPTRGVVGESSCLILEPTNGGDEAVELWVDPQHDYVIKRAIMSYKGRETARLDIDYAADPIAGWLPKEWSWVHLNDRDNLDLALRASLDSRSINMPVSAAEFTIDEPAGAVVHDLRSGPPVVRWIGGTGPDDAPPDWRKRLVVLGNIVVAVVVAWLVAARRFSPWTRKE